MRRKELQILLSYDFHTGIFYSNNTGQPVGNIEVDGYVYIWIRGVKYKACDLAWFYISSCWPLNAIVHRDGVNHHDWFDNLEVPVKKIQSNNKWGIPGVSYDKTRKKWRAQIFIDGRAKNLGNYDKFAIAVLARSKAEDGGLATQYIKEMFFAEKTVDTKI